LRGSTQNVKENLKKKLKSSGAQQRRLDPRKMQKKNQKNKNKIKRGHTHESHYYLQLINFTQQKIKNIKIKPSGGQTHAA